MNSNFVVSFVSYYQHRYPEFRTYEMVCGYSDSLDGAEHLMHQFIDNGDEIVFCFYIREEPVNTLCIGRTLKCKGALSERVYDAGGNLLDSRGRCDEFNGRVADKIRFKPGDIVEVYDDCSHSVYLGFVMEVPMLIESVNEIKAQCKENGELFRLDCSDDQYMIMRDDSGMHWHIMSQYLFKPHFVIPKPTFNRLQRQYLKQREKIP